MLRLAIACLGAATLAVLLAADGRASLHHPDGVVAAMIPVDDKGAPEPYPFDEFSRRRVVLRNIGNADWPLVAINPQTKQPITDPKTGQPQLSDRGEVDARVKREQKKRPEARTEEESAALAVDLLRLGRADEAESALQKNRNGFLANVTLAHIAVAQNTRDHPTWSRALNFLDIANELADDKRNPVKVPGISPQKLAWQLKLNRGPLMTFLRLRGREADAKAAEAKAPDAKKNPDLLPENELPDRLFDVNFVNDAGAYEPGKLAAAEKAKLPGGDFPEAIATVQQFVLWFPFDWRLYWLLGELYAAQGEFKTAQKIMDECVNSGFYSNRKVLMQHREAVAKLANVEPPPEPEPTPVVPFTMGAVWWYFGAVGAVALFALVRALLRWSKFGG